MIFFGALLGRLNRFIPNFDSIRVDSVFRRLEGKESGSTINVENAFHGTIGKPFQDVANKAKRHLGMNLKKEIGSHGIANSVQLFRYCSISVPTENLFSKRRTRA